MNEGASRTNMSSVKAGSNVGFDTGKVGEAATGGVVGTSLGGTESGANEGRMLLGKIPCGEADIGRIPATGLGALAPTIPMKKN